MAFDIIAAEIATASDTFACEAGIRGGQIMGPGDDFGSAGEIVDASGKRVLLDGIDVISAPRSRQVCHGAQNIVFEVGSPWSKGLAD
jgi:hypothetical protein